MAKETGNSLGSMDEIRMIFNKFDQNGDGRISCGELTAVLCALGSQTSDSEVSRIMCEIDTDGDGLIDLDEFAAWFQTGAGSDSDGSNNCASNKELKDAFDLYDRDGNGLITAGELHAVLKSLGEKCTLRDCKRMISSVDADGDGNVNFEEFKKMMTKA